LDQADLYDYGTTNPPPGTTEGYCTVIARAGH
jgi:hypothetical protein